MKTQKLKYRKRKLFFFFFLCVFSADFSFSDILFQKKCYKILPVRQRGSLHISVSVSSHHIRQIVFWP